MKEEGEGGEGGEGGGEDGIFKTQKDVESPESREPDRTLIERHSLFLHHRHHHFISTRLQLHFTSTPLFFRLTSSSL